MNKHIKTLALLEEMKVKAFELGPLIYGSVEIRINNSKKYIYCHTRENGIQVTKYIGEYTDVLYNMIVENNEKAKILKKDIRGIEKELKKLGYVDGDLEDSVRLNIDFARVHLADTIYKQAILEGVATTLLDTENIIEGGKVNNMSVGDVMKIVNLKHAWDFILYKNVILTSTNYSILCTINKLILEGFYYNAGIPRNVPVKIGGTNWVPTLPMEVNIVNGINDILSKKKSDIDKAIDILLYIVRGQFFIDGNKRTSIIFANHYLISKGKGLIVIPVEEIDTYKKLLIDYYESNNKSEISKFIKERCYLTYN